MTIHRPVITAVLLLATRPAAAFDTWWHAQTTHDAASATGFSADAQLVLQVENYFTDMISGTTSEIEKRAILPTVLGSTRIYDEGYDYLHFDALWDIMQVSHNWDTLEQNTIAALRKYGTDTSMPDSFRKIAELTVLAASLHTVQDFYSHSNWVNYWVKQGGTVPIWFDVDPKVRDTLDIQTGAYPDGSSAGHQDHVVLNKDTSARKLNAPAVEAARRASEDWIKRLQVDDPSLPWAEMKSYDIQSDNIMKHFLEELDATFLTTSSIVAGHLDGAHPKVQVFAPGEPDRELRIAKTMLRLTVEQYVFYSVMKGNTYHLPSPYWSSHFVYHVPRDLAVGMMCADKTYRKPTK